MAYWAAVDDNASGLSSMSTKSGGIRWMAESFQIDRLSPEAASGQFPPNAIQEDGRVQVLVIFFSDVVQADAELLVRNTGAEFLEWIGTRTMKAALRQENLQTLASLDGVEWVEPVPPPNTMDNATASQREHATELRTAPYSLNGKNVTVGVWDGGQIDTHPDFGSRLTVVDTDMPVHYHATHVGGTIGGNAASGQSNALGMAPSVFLRSYNWNSDTSEMRGGAASGIQLSNHSYGEVVGYYWDSSKNAWDFWPNTYRFGMYASSSQEYDDVVYDTGLIVFKAAGNDRGEGDGPYDCIPPRGVAKNVITIGATDDGDSMTSFSSWGPVDDGRVKPDLCANGYGLYSTMPNGSFSSMSGTSMACPSACGAGAMLYQLYENELGETPSPETLKALMIHGAVDLGRTGPDYTYGWGLVHAKNSADLILGRMYREGTVSNGNYVPYTVTVPSGSSQLKVTLVWTDPAGSPSASKALVNDLDLVLRSPSGQTYLPWVLDKSNPSSSATTGVNTVDNVEQVVLANPASGVWTVEVKGTAIAQGPGEYTVVTEEFANGDSSQAFRIYNDGDGTLDVSSMSVADGAWVQYSPPAPFSVAPGEFQKVNVWINYDGAPYGASSRQIEIESNDSEGNSPYPNGVIVNIDNNATPTPVPTVAPTATPTSTATPAPQYPIINIDPLSLNFVYSGRLLNLNGVQSVSPQMSQVGVGEALKPTQDEPNFDVADVTPDGRILVWSAFAPGTDLQELRRTIEARGDIIISLVPEGRLLLAVLPENLLLVSSTAGVENVSPALPRTDTIQEAPPMDEPFLGANPPSDEEQQFVDQTFMGTQSLDPNTLSILRANLEGQAQVPTAADNTLSQYFPPVRSQGSQGSCTCWAACYYYNTFTQAKDEGYDVSGGNNDYINSPGFMYPLINGGRDGGGYTSYVVSRLNDIGCASWTKKPYSSSDYTSWPSEDAWLEALNNRTKTNHYISVTSDSGVAALKQHLANGNIAVTQTPVYTNWYSWSDNKSGISNGVLYSHAGASLVGYHAMTVVGYDDNRAYTGGKGAFLIANSWGKYWGTYNSSGSGTKGFMWVSYDYFRDVFRVAYYNDDRDDYRPMMYAATGMDHPNRIQVGYKGGVGSPSSSDWQSSQALDKTSYKPGGGGTYALSSSNPRRRRSHRWSR